VKLERLAEQNIERALARGELDNLPGAGAPLELDDDSLVPEELRAAYRILKNHGLAPVPVRARQQLISAIEAEYGTVDRQGKRDAVKRLALLSMQLERHGVGQLEFDQYRRQIVARMRGDTKQVRQSDD
jgi:hypothetical protein